MEPGAATPGGRPTPIEAIEGSSTSSSTGTSSIASSVPALALDRDMISEDTNVG